MDQNIVCRDRCCLSLHVVLCRNDFSFSTVSVKWREKKTHSCCFCPFLCGCNVSCCPSSLWNISFPAFCISEDSSQRYIPNEYMLPSLSSNKSFPDPVKYNESIYKINDTLLLHFLSWHLCSIVYLPNIQQTN